MLTSKWFVCQGCGRRLRRDPVPAAFDKVRGYQSFCEKTQKVEWCVEVKVPDAEQR